jgi:hypothetical protein
MAWGSRPLPLVSTGNIKATPEAKATNNNIQFSRRKFTNQTFWGKKNKGLSVGRQHGF